VQQECLPKALIGQDVLCQAKSGMGKTAVFVLSILNQLPTEPKPCAAIVLCHTRELAYQIKNEFARFTKHLPACKTEVIYGGTPLKDHIKLFKDTPPTIVVGTPGRILDLVKRKYMKLEDVKTFVVDECDKVLESLGKSNIFRHFLTLFRHEIRCATNL
jgi:ATP-dependent RNA helicase UAP56/SUB2